MVFTEGALLSTTQGGVFYLFIYLKSIFIICFPVFFSILTVLFAARDWTPKSLIIYSRSYDAVYLYWVF